MSTHNICFCGEIRKILMWIPHLSGAKHCSNKKAMLSIANHHSKQYEAQCGSKTSGKFY